MRPPIDAPVPRTCRHTVRGRYGVSAGAAMSEGYKEEIGVALNGDFLLRQEIEEANTATTQTVVNGVFGGESTSEVNEYVRPLQSIGFLEASSVLEFSECVRAFRPLAERPQSPRLHPRACAASRTVHRRPSSPSPPSCA